MNSERKSSGNSSIWILVVFLVTFVVGTVCAFVLVNPYTTKFWFSYFACLIALCCLMFGFWRTSQSINRPSTFLFTTVSLIYVTCVIIATVLGNVFPLSSAWLGAIELIILALYIILMIVSLLAHRNISEQTDREKKQVHNAQANIERVQRLIAQTERLPEDSREIARKALLDVEEKLRYSDPISGRGTEREAQDMENAICNLESNMNYLIDGDSDINLFEETAHACIDSIDTYNRAKLINK